MLEYLILKSISKSGLSFVKNTYPYKYTYLVLMFNNCKRLKVAIILLLTIINYSLLVK
jgi:hypothetical protein